MRQIKVYKKDVPAEFTVDTYIRDTTDIDQQIEKFKKDTTRLAKFKLPDNIDTDILKQSAENAFSEFGWHGYLLSGYVSDPSISQYARSENYGGLSITYNPQYVLSDNVDINTQTLGSVRYNIPRELAKYTDLVAQHSTHARAHYFWLINTEGPGSAWDYVHELGLVSNELYYKNKQYFNSLPYDPRARTQNGKDTYSDSLSFNRLTPACSQGYLGDFFSKVKRSFSKGQIVSMKGGDVPWHRDEHYYMSLRLNIPLCFDPTTRLKTEHFAERMYPGYVYHWNTQEAHTIERLAEDNEQRINIVMGVSPWFDYNDQEQCWVSNEFYGEIHPWDMLEQGLIVDFIS